MRKVSSIVIASVFLSLATPVHAQPAKAPRVAAFAKSLLVWLNGKMSPPWPAPAPPPESASNDTDRTKS